MYCIKCGTMLHTHKNICCYCNVDGMQMDNLRLYWSRRKMPRQRQEKKDCKEYRHNKSNCPWETILENKTGGK